MGNFLSQSQLAYDEIKRLIITLQLAPGAIIDEPSLVAELGYGRTPIREALKRLALEKLVTIVPRRGMFVTDVSITDLPRLFEMRLVLEPLAAQLAATRGRPADWTALEALLAEIDPEAIGPNNEAWLQVDEGFHEIIYEATNNPVLADTLRILYALSVRLWYLFLYQLDDMRDAVMEHQQILDALRARDGDLAAELTERHLRAFQEAIHAAMLESPRNS